MDPKAFVNAWQKGEVCLHPTDTLPGLSFHPELKNAEENFMAIKERPEDKRPISLIASWSVAERIWQPLPEGWANILQKLWPASLSVIWLASDACPKSLRAEDGTCALRMPLWSQDKAWMRAALLELDKPFPSSSVNRSGEPAEVSWESAVAFSQKAKRPIHVPNWKPEHQSLSPQPSTVIRLKKDGSYDVIREGAIPTATIEKLLASS